MAHEGTAASRGAAHSALIIHAPARCFGAVFSSASGRIKSARVCLQHRGSVRNDFTLTYFFPRLSARSDVHLCSCSSAVAYEGSLGYVLSPFNLCVSRVNGKVCIVPASNPGFSAIGSIISSFKLLFAPTVYC